MNDIIKMAREAGLIPPPLDWPQKYAEALERFAALVRADEREQCAKAAEKTVCDTHLPTGVKMYGTRVAKVIRARSNT